MKFVLFALCALGAVVADEKYKSQNNLNVAELLENDRLLVSYIKCLLDKGPCTPAVQEIKDKLPEALATKCAKCTDEQKQMGKTLVNEVKKRHPDLWNELSNKYDNNGKHRQAFQEFLQS